MATDKLADSVVTSEATLSLSVRSSSFSILSRTMRGGREGGREGGRRGKEYQLALWVTNRSVIKTNYPHRGIKGGGE